ncbi:hypothetical protein PENSPDRAFT_513891 [Peniophora sp. CONT]|nr:hypothetical protein PENSPDRAFT_513891 [Peniophora sp. CONT]
MALFEITFIAIQTIVISGLGLILALPIWGTLVRIRANYTPKVVQLETEDNVQPPTGSAVTGFIAMMSRTKHLEGWPGLYRGLMPTLLFDVVIALLERLVLYGSLAGRIWIAFGAPGLGYRGIILLYISIPLSIIKARAITTPHRVGYFTPERSLRVLLSHTERRRPWILYFTPGLLIAVTINIAYTFGLRALRTALFGGPSTSDKTYWGFYLVHTTWLRLGMFYGTILAASLVLCPLEVATVRLSVQRNHDAEGDAEETTVPYASADEDVLELRPEADPYLGLADCARKIVREEGWMALYRGWWLTLVFKFFGAFTY